MTARTQTHTHANMYMCWTLGQNTQKYVYIQALDKNGNAQKQIHFSMVF